ncbi:type II secretion system major pseudopilin GspG [Arenimonas sp. MALMAid1274]|uniref:type II secretion system major pseudopilin GspG n=1 Tax=Arenimonas sp. MALMAid1274 TaxID=3411630 RepID=UPI003BA1AD81
MRRIPQLHARARGFSLIEIIIVIVLIGTVMALITRSVMGGSDRGNVKITETQLSVLAGKVDQFRMDTGKLPESLDQLATSPGMPGWLGPYATADELKDPWGAPIEFKRPGANGPYELVSLGADSAPGGDSVDADIRKP